MPAIEIPTAGAHSRVSRQRKRKEPEIVDERTARLQKRMVSTFIGRMYYVNTCVLLCLCSQQSRGRILDVSASFVVQVKNRESAARSRARKQEYTAQLEVQVAKLRQENRLLLEKASFLAIWRPWQASLTLDVHISGYYCLAHIKPMATQCCMKTSNLVQLR